MLLIDTHTHIYLPEFDSDRDETIERALKNNVKILLLPNIDTGSLESMISTSERYSGICIPMIGLHPTSVNKNYAEQLETLRECFGIKNFIAVGETGIDLYWDKTFISEQIIAFRTQLTWAVEYRLPVVIHSRNSFSEIFSVLNEFKGSEIKGVFHAFSGSTEIAQKVVELGFMLGIGGVVTYKNSGLEKVVKEAGPDNMVLETDSPFLAPVPYRGKRNESSYICIINEKVAEILGMKETETAAITTHNALKLFNINE
ncbi:MAG: TatD family hydrolase [Bacteroidales bacterium]